MTTPDPVGERCPATKTFTRTSFVKPVGGRDALTPDPATVEHFIVCRDGSIVHRCWRNAGHHGNHGCACHTVWSPS